MARRALLRRLLEPEADDAGMTIVARAEEELAGLYGCYGFTVRCWSATAGSSVR